MPTGEQFIILAGTAHPDLAAAIAAELGTNLGASAVDIPVDSLTAVPTLCQALRARLGGGAVVVSPDTGRVAMASEYGHRLGTPVVVLHKRRASGTETEVTHVIGEVRDRPCLIID